MFAKFSPDGTRVAYVRAQNLYVEDLGSGRILAADQRRRRRHRQRHVRLGERGGARHLRRLPLEPGRPADRLLAVRHHRRRAVHADQQHRLALSALITRIPYPKAGTTNSAVRVGVVGADGGPTTWVKTPGDPRDNYIPRIEWADDAHARRCSS